MLVVFESRRQMKKNEKNIEKNSGNVFSPSSFPAGNDGGNDVFVVEELCFCWKIDNYIN